jgi:glutaredoxin
MSIRVYGKKECIYCKKLDALMKEYNIPCQTFYPSTKQEVDYIKKLSNMNTYPMIFFNSTCIGGFTEFQNMIMTNTLQEKLNATGVKDINIQSIF